jgi:hypothetical protein
MHNLDSLVFEALTYVSPGTYSYLFYNGNTNADAETVPAICTVNAYREVNVVNDTIVQTVCFAACTPCVTGLISPEAKDNLFVYPNPVVDRFVVSNSIKNAAQLLLYDIKGNVTRNFSPADSYSVQGVSPGVYRLVVVDSSGKRVGAKSITIQ